MANGRTLLCEKSDHTVYQKCRATRCLSSGIWSWPSGRVFEGKKWESEKNLKSRLAVWEVVVVATASFLPVGGASGLRLPFVFFPSGSAGAPARCRWHCAARTAVALAWRRETFT